MKRREFIGKSTLAAAGTWLLPAFLKPLEGMAAHGPAQGKNLVVIQLSGGNDGLNTIVPYGDDIYYQKRSSIALKPAEIIKLNTMQGLNPNLAALQPVYDAGLCTIINTVGYPNPDRSHFRSMDIWQTGSAGNEFLTSGWLGRYLDASCPADPRPYTAIEVDDTLSLALKGKKYKGMAISNAQKLYQNTSGAFNRQLAAHVPAHLGEDNLGYLYKTLIQTASAASYINEKSKTYTSRAAYPNSAFAGHLKTIANFIISNVGARVYYVSLSGFDTHVNQTSQQGSVLKQYAEGLAAFINELKANSRLSDTLVMTFSEFGRRVEQNSSNGTDHGTANNVMLYGTALKKPGIYNRAPNLANLAEGDLQYTVDFRDVYAAILQNWLQAAPAGIVNPTGAQLNII